MADEKKFYRFDNNPEGIVWLVYGMNAQAYCDEHKVPIRSREYYDHDETYCPVDQRAFSFRNASLLEEQNLVIDLLDREHIKDLPVIRVDSEGVDVVAKEKIKLVDEYWIEGKVMDTAKGIQAMIQFGRRSSPEKVQLFVDPGRQRVGFDLSDKDKHPAGVFSEVKVTFKDSVTIIKEADSVVTEESSE